jgi:hypothetical protein
VPGSLWEGQLHSKLTLQMIFMKLHMERFNEALCLFLLDVIHFVSLMKIVRDGEVELK